MIVFTHPDCLAHQPGPGHPESPDRLRAVLAALRGPGFAGLDWAEAPEATVAQLEAVHGAAHVRALLAAVPPPGGRISLDADTHLGPGSVRAALLAAGGAVAAADAVAGGRAAIAFAAVRPPGHHAEPNEAMGFCLFNGVAVAAAHARAAHGITRVAVLDFDVHHGNGTQAMFWNDPDLFYGSTHQMPCYPGTGAVEEAGVAGNIVNHPLRPGDGGAAFRAGWTRILAAMAGFDPQLVIVSAGFDAHRADLLAGLMLEEADFAWIATRILHAAGGRLACVLEGGYDLEALAASTAAFVQALLAEETGLTEQAGE